MNIINCYFYTLWCWIRISTLKILLQAKLEDFLQLLHTVQNRTPLTEVQNPSNNNKQNILHHVLEIGRQDLALAVIQNCDVSLLCQQCDVTVAGIRGKKNVLHYITELRSLDLAKAVLNKVRHSLKKKGCHWSLPEVIVNLEFASVKYIRSYNRIIKGNVTRSVVIFEIISVRLVYVFIYIFPIFCHIYKDIQPHITYCFLS